jgi:eukaryotic-like serine/threonine-protein kinase
MSQRSDRSLLLGILALQNDLLTRDQLIEAMNAWAAAKDRPLGEILVARQALDQEHRQLLEQLLDVHVRRHGSVEHSMAACELTSSVRSALAQVADVEVQATLSVWQQPATSAPSSTAAAPTGRRSAASDHIRYRVLRPHAKGGLGEVFVAEDLELHREVALKEIQRQHADQDASRGRFVLEAEITGGLEHPGIVPVYGLGTYADGRPFYAMRFIKGDNLKHACARFHESGARFDSLEFRQLLGRFIDVCNAVGYAHSRGVLHRDLKPGNIMLGEFGETLVVDWGLAKVVSHTDSSDERPMLVPASGSSVAETMQGMAIGTPAYMSPEQALGKVTELGPSTDVYSLGATLYALLTNRPPIVDDDLATVLHKVMAGDIPPPRDVNSAIPEPLEAICRKAMALEPTERYATALALASDVEQWLADEPVSCFVEPWAVRAARWTRRHRVLVAAAVAVTVVLIASLAAGLTLVTRHSQQLAREKDKTDAANLQLADSNRKLEQSNVQERAARAAADEQRASAERSAEAVRMVLTFFEEQVLAAARPETQAGGLGINVTVRAAIDAAEPKIAASFPDEPLVEGSIRNTVGITYQYLGLTDLAIRQFERSVELMRATLGPDHPNTLTCMNCLASSYALAGQFEKALPLLEETLERKKASLGPDHPSTLLSMHNLAASYRNARQFEKALPLLEETLTLQKVNLGPDHPNTLQSMQNLACAYADSDQLGKALPLWEATLELMKAHAGPNHPDTLNCMTSLASGYRNAGQLEKALPLWEATLDLMKAHLGPDHPETLNCMNNLASAYLASNQLVRALPLWEESLQLTKAKLGPDHPTTLTTMSSLAWGYLHTGQSDKAVPLLEEALQLAKAKLGPDHSDTLSIMNNLAEGYRVSGQFDKALPLFQESLQLTKARLGPDHPNTLTCLNNLAGGYRDSGQLEKALSLWEENLEIVKAKLGPDHPTTLTCINNLATGYADAGQLEKALPLSEQAAQGVERVRFRHEYADRIIPNTIATYEKAQQFAQADQWRRKWLQFVKAQAGAESTAYAAELAAYGMSLLWRADCAAAETVLRECVVIREKSAPDDWRTLNTKSMLGGALLGQAKQLQATDAAAAAAKFTAAEPLLVQGYEGMQQRADKIPPESKSRLSEALQRLVDLHTAWGKPEEAARWHQKLDEVKAAEAKAATPAAADAAESSTVPAQVEPAPKDKKE